LALIRSQPTLKRTQRVHNAVGVLVQISLMTRLVGVIKNAHQIILKYNFVIVWIGHYGIKIHALASLIPAKI
jgi:hypothetical protein